MATHTLDAMKQAVNVTLTRPEADALLRSVQQLAEAIGEVLPAEGTHITGEPAQTLTDLKFLCREAEVYLKQSAASATDAAPEGGVP